MNYSYVPPSKHDTLTQCWGKVGPKSETAGKYYPSTGSMYRVCWACNKQGTRCRETRRWHWVVLMLGQHCRRWLHVGAAHSNPVNTKHLYNICTMLDQRQRRWADVVQILKKNYFCWIQIPRYDEAHRFRHKTQLNECGWRGIWATFMTGRLNWATWIPPLRWSSIACNSSDTGFEPHFSIHGKYKLHDLQQTDVYVIYWIKQTSRFRIIVVFD